MSLKRSLSGLGKLIGQPQAEPTPPPEPAQEAGPREITARIARKHRESTTIDEPLAAALLELWRQASVRIDDAGEAEISRNQMAELSERLFGLAAGELPDLDTCRGMVVVLGQVVPELIDALNARVRDLSQGTREIQRKVGQHELQSSHLRDELDRCRTLIDQECARRGLPHVAEDPLDLHGRLARLLEAQTAPAMAANMSDPVIAVLEKLIASNDADALRTLPEWVKRPAARVLDLIAERNRYRRLLEHAGMLPPPAR
jgi:hypothetical protein